MAFRALALRGGSSTARPFVDVLLGPHDVPCTCLVDSGALGVRLPLDLGRAAGLDLPAQPTGEDLVFHGQRSQVIEASVPLRIPGADGGVLAWEAEVAFMDPWSAPFGLLGLRGFFDVFDVGFRARPAQLTVSR